ncbi:geranylgeranylglycerol-phosphate geranylgeranyltransferase [Candidatus Bathyarchaeota archaeon]|nr:geranylgeranylglycerol-phosphate geranylgeranyltransferase [Candidatus Bathyarchaeota archaeon]MBS7628259.1 geranylgeranylglycerol-phosphate geranylgeranyltransferase [Candidatus Bathyarchaeota archaeon]
MALGKLEGFIRLMRPANCLMMGFAVIVGAIMAYPKALIFIWEKIFLGAITGFLLTASSMVINDYYDREIDAINEPSRPIPSGLIKPKEAFSYALLITVLGFLASLFTSLLCLFIAAMAWVISVTYTTIGKRTGFLGNLLVSACVSVPFLYGSVAALDKVHENILIFVLMVFLSNTGREVNKGIVDVEGDRIRNIRTLAVCYGERRAAMVASVLYISSVLLSPIPWILGLVSFPFIPMVTMADLGLLASSTLLLKDFSKEMAKKVKNLALLSFMAGLLAFLFGSLF